MTMLPRSRSVSREDCIVQVEFDKRHATKPCQLGQGLNGQNDIIFRYTEILDGPTVDANYDRLGFEALALGIAR